MLNDQFQNSEDPDSKQWRHLNDAQRMHLIHHLFILHPRLNVLCVEMNQRVLEAVSAIIDQAVFPEPMVITSESRVGKTVLLQRWLAQKKREHEPADSKRPFPYLSLSIPPQGTVKEFLSALLWATGSDTSMVRNATTHTLYQHLQLLLQKIPIHLLLLDYCEYLISVQNQCITSPLGDLLKDIIITMRIGFILVGLSQEIELLVGNNPRLARRIGLPRQLFSFSWDRQSPETVAQYCAFMQTIDSALPFDTSGLSEKTMAYRIFCATGGSLGWTMKLLTYAATKALQEKDSIISIMSLARVYEACIAGTSFGAGKVNPFLKEYPTDF